MSKIREMSMAEIFNKVDIKFDLADISKICPNKEARNKICELILSGKDHVEVMVDSEAYIDKEKLLLVTWLNYKKEIEEKKKELSSASVLNTPLNKTRLEQEIRDLNNILSKIRKLSRDIDIYLVTVHHKDKIATDITVISSKEEILGFDFSEREKYNREIFDYIDRNLLTEQDDLGMKYALQTIEYEDFEKGMPYDIAQAVTHRIRTNNIILGENYISWFKEKQKKGEEDDEEVERLSDEYRENVALPEMRSAVKEVLRYIDFKKLLLIEIYRLEKNLDESFSSSNRMSNERLHAAQKVASFLLGIIEKDAKIEDGDVTYSYVDAQNFLNRIDIEKDLYITTNEAKELKEELLQGLNLEKVNQEEKEKFCRLSYTSEELEKTMNISKENLNFGMTMQDLSEDQIIQKAHQYKDKWSDELTEYFHSEGKLSIISILGLYYDDIISAEFFKEFSEENDISSEINLNEIKILRLQNKQQKEPNEDDEKKLDAMVKLYKLINLDEKNEEEKAKVYTEVIEIAEDEQDTLFYYERGLLTLEIVAEWNGDSAIEKLYDESKITFEDIELLYKNGKISINLLKSKFQTEGLDYSTLLFYIDLGYVSEEAIIDMYMKGKIFDYDFEDIFTKGIIPIQKYLDATSKRTKEELEKNARIKFKPTLVNIPDKKIRLETIDEESESDKTTLRDNKKTLIDPNIRYEFLKLLGAKEAEAIIDDENNAFYNYEFFVIPDCNGELQANSVVIAERFFEDKETPYRFATENATYFFQYKDLMVNSNLTKKEMTQDRDNIVFTANHRAGSWAVSVLYRIAQTLSGDNFKNYKKGDERATVVIDNLLKIYSKEKLDGILDLAKQIDDTGEYIYEEVNSSYSKKNLDEQDDNEER